MKVTNSVAAQAAQNYLTGLQRRDPPAYRIITARMGRSAMAGIGAAQNLEEASDEWSSIFTGFGDLLATGAKIYSTDQLAKRAAEREASAAAQALATAQANAALLAAQTQDRLLRDRLNKEIAETKQIEKAARNVAGEKRLFIYAGLGVAALLILPRVFG